MRRGEIWWADLDPLAGRRPVLLLSRDEAYSVRSLIIVAPVTTRIRNIASEVPLGTADGTPRPCVANLDTITTVPKDCLRALVVNLSPKKLDEVDAALRFALGLK